MSIYGQEMKRHQGNKNKGRGVLIITCEHAGNRVPKEYRALFSKERARLDSYRGYDIGAHDVVRHLIRACRPAHVSEYFFTRLLADGNRSETNRTIFSSITRQRTPEERRHLLDRYWRPYREKIVGTITDYLRRGYCVFHCAVHSFTPVLNGTERRVDVGLLFDPSCAHEKALCTAIKRSLVTCVNGLRVRFNYPYKGVSDGLATYMRTHCASRPGRYFGIELELNQKHVGTPLWLQLKKAIAGTVNDVQVQRIVREDKAF